MLFDKESFLIDSKVAVPTDLSAFYGYCFNNEKLFHYKAELPDLHELWQKRSQNTGVFCCVLSFENKTVIFSDPLSQYSLFYKIEQDGRFLISNDIFSIASNAECMIDQAAMLNCVSYFSPIGNNTLLEGVKTLKPYQYIELTRNQNSLNFNIKDIEAVDFSTSTYEELLALCVNRIKQRAKAAIDSGVPIVQLTGGQDSRLSLAALLSVSEPERFRVSCFGGEQSEDKKIFNYLKKKFGLKETSMFLSGDKPGNFEEAKLVARVFNGLKHSAQSNFNCKFCPEHIEITGYFSEGLLKDFGNYFKGGIFSPFQYAKKVSVLPRHIFDAASFNLYEEISAKELSGVSYAERLNWLYLNNRSTAQMGAQSIANNRCFIGADVIYDPFLIALYSKCPLTSQQKAEGALICELTRLLAGDALAFAPLAGASISCYGDFTKDDEPSIFNRVPLTEEFKNESHNPIRSYLYSIDTHKKSYHELFSTLEFKEFLKVYPVFEALTEQTYGQYSRKPEFEALISIFGFWLELKEICNSNA